MVYTADWFSGNIPNWKKWTAPLAGKPIRAVEIGSFEGRSTRWIVDSLLGDSESRIDCVDTWEGSPEHGEHSKNGLFDRFRENLCDAIESGKVIPHRGLSQNELPKLFSAGNTYDFAYIDGSHTSRDTLSDAVHVFPMLKEGGIMIFDDYNWYGFKNPLKNPRTGIDAFLQVYSGCYEVIAKEYQVAIRKINDTWLYQPDPPALPASHS